MRRVADPDTLNRFMPALIECVPATLEEVHGLLEAEHPDYARFLAEQWDEIAAGVARFMTRLVSASGVEAADLASAVERAAFEEIGRQHHRDGREVTGLLATYRIGARVAWRHLSRAALSAGIPAAGLASLGCVLFAAVDQLSAASVRGYLREHSLVASGRERFRVELTELLLSDRASLMDVCAAAARAQWPLPRKAAVVLADPDSEVAHALSFFDGEACLRLQRRDDLVAIVADPAGPGRRDRLTALLHGAGTVVGPTVSVDGLPTSLSVARLAVRLRCTGLFTDDPLFAEDHLDALIVHQDDRLLAALRQRSLAPLAHLPAPVRERLLETLRSWLRNLGERNAVAAELHIHPQTVRYRLRQLREQFGDTLADPHVRESLMLSLAWGSDTGDEPPSRAPNAR